MGQFTEVPLEADTVGPLVAVTPVLVPAVTVVWVPLVPALVFVTPELALVEAPPEPPSKTVTLPPHAAAVATVTMKGARSREAMLHEYHIARMLSGAGHRG